MTKPPLLDPATFGRPIQPRYALLINPFYPKDPNASFGKHVLTPTLALTSFPATPLFRQMETAGRLLHSDWALYDTAHAVFRPKHMSPEELEEGYEWIYERLFSHASIWRRRPEDWRAVGPYLAMSYLYKRSNRFWRLLIRHHLVHAVWWPLAELTRLRHMRFRRRLAGTAALDEAPIKVVAARV